MRLFPSFKYIILCTTILLFLHELSAQEAMNYPEMAL